MRRGCVTGLELSSCQGHVTSGKENTLLSKVDRIEYSPLGRDSPAPLLLAAFAFVLLLVLVPIPASALRTPTPISPGTPQNIAPLAPCLSASPAGCPRDDSVGDNGTYVTGRVTYHHGPVMHDVTNYLIFWLPPGYAFDNQTIDPTASNPSDARYEGLIEQYLRDVPGSAFYNILQQYTDYTGPPGWTAYGGYIVDTTPFPGGAGTQASPVTDQDTWDRMQSDIQAQGWTANSGNNEFFLFLPYDVYYEGYNDSCSFHTWFWVGSTNYTYSLLPDAGSSYFNGGCLNSAIEAYAGTAGPSPNGDIFADSEINNMAHEQFESVSDPIWANDNPWGGWWYQDGDHEIADECQWQFGPRDSSGGDVILKGHEYLIQPMWSNSAGGCYLPPLIHSTTITLVPANPAASLSPSNAFQITYVAGGASSTAYATGGTLSIDADFGTVVWLAGVSNASSSSERWVVNASEPVGVASPDNVTVEYYLQYYVQIQTAQPAGGTVMDSGWYNASSSLTLSAAAGPDWKFEGWSGSGGASYSGGDASHTVVLLSPITETATFDAGVTLSVDGSGQITYGSGGNLSTLGEGSVTVYFPPGTRIDLSASPSSFLYTFQGYNGGVSSTNSAGSLTVGGPALVTASFALNYAVIAGGAGAAIIAVVLVFVMWKRRGGRKDSLGASVQRGTGIQ